MTVERYFNKISSHCRLGRNNGGKISMFKKKKVVHIPRSDIMTISMHQWQRSSSSWLPSLMEPKLSNIFITDWEVSKIYQKYPKNATGLDKIPLVVLKFINYKLSPPSSKLFIPRNSFSDYITVCFRLCWLSCERWRFSLSNPSYCGAVR